MKELIIITTVAIVIAQFPVFSEEKAPSGANERMIKMLPALRNATGKKKDQLVALCQVDCMALADTQKVDRVFNLSDSQDSALLQELLSNEENREIQGQLCVLFAAFGEQSVRWLLGYYKQASPWAKANIIHKMGYYLEFREVYEFLAGALEDKTTVPDRSARAQAAPGYIDERICDHAFSKLVLKIKRSGVTLPDAVRSGFINPFESTEKRDQKISALQSYLSDSGNKEWSQLLLKKPSIKP